LTPDSLLNVEVVTGAALLAALAGLLAATWPRRLSADEWIRHRTKSRSTDGRSAKQGVWGRVGPLVWGLGAAANRRLPAALRAALSGQLSRAGIALPQETVVSMTLLLMVAVACLLTALVLDGVVPPDLAVLAVVAVPLIVAAEVGQRAGRRRRAILDQLPILVDLMALEQGGGGVGARAAIELVVSRLDGDAAMLLRNCLTSSATAGTPQLDRQLEVVGAQLDIAAFSALAAAVRIQREEGVSTSSPLGQLARGLRDRQRDELLSRGRRALVTMLLPVAICILLPFVIIILYPAIERLSAAFG
jgi:Flp pilus assembly protein TadB